MFNIGLSVLGIIITFAATSLGALFVFFFKREIEDKLNSIILGFAGGVMFAACIWGLILPAIDQCAHLHKLAFLPIVCGVAGGSLLLIVIDKFCPTPKNKFKSKKDFRFLLAVTIHNMPEGLIVGLAFGGALAGQTGIYSALILAIGIALQNIPEGMAVSFALKPNLGNKSAFVCGVLSGAVEPIFAIIGLLLATKLTMLMPWFLAFAAGVMIHVTVDDIIPDAKCKLVPHLGTNAFVFGFLIMMALEIVLG